MSDNKPNTDFIRNIEEKLKKDWTYLKVLPQLLEEEKCFYLCKDEKVKEKIINYVSPTELKQLIHLTIEELPNKEEDLTTLCRQVIKYSVKTSHGNFYNQLFGQIDPYGLAGTWISETLNTSAYTFEVAPVFSLIETEIIQSTIKLCGYEQGDGIFTPGGSISNMYGLILARYNRYPDIKTKGLLGLSRPLVLFTSEESHYSFKKAANWLGLGMENVILVKTDYNGCMLVSDLEARIQITLAEGKEPFFVNATAGSTVLGAFDDFVTIAAICKKYNLWLHIDACLGGSLIYSDKNRHLLKGIELSNSIAWNPHKSLGVPLQCSMFLTNELELLAKCNSFDVSYLFQQDKYYDVSYDTGNKSVQCGRKIDAFKFWLMLKARGYRSYGHLLDHAMSMARKFAVRVKERAGYRLVLEQYQYTNVCFWYLPKALRDKEETKEWQQRLHEVAPKVKEQMAYAGTLMIGYTPLAYRGLGNFFRMVFTCFPIMNEAQIDFVLDEIERLAEKCIF